MNRYLTGLFISTAVCALLLFVSGCGYNGDTRTSVYSGYYSSNSWHDPYYRYPCCRGDTIIVTPPGHRPPPGQRPPGVRPPPGQRPPGVRPPPGQRPPGARPPAQLPSRPRPTPRPMPRARAR